MGGRLLRREPLAAVLPRVLEDPDMEVIQAWAAVAGVMVSAVMVAVTLIGFLFVRHQIVLMRQAIRHDSQTTLYHDNFECTRALLQEDGLYLYFRSNKAFSDDFTSGRWLGGEPPDNDGKDEKGAALARCKERRLYCKALELSELFASHFEHVVLQMDTLPKDLRTTWQAYMHDVHAQSPVLRQFLIDHKNWYSAGLMEAIEAGAAVGQGGRRP